MDKQCNMAVVAQDNCILEFQRGPGIQAEIKMKESDGLHEQVKRAPPHKYHSVRRPNKDEPHTDRTLPPSARAVPAHMSPQGRVPHIGLALGWLGSS